MCLSYCVNECLLSLIIKVLFIYFVCGIYMYMRLCTYVCRFTYVGVCSLEVNVGYFPSTLYFETDSFIESETP